MTEEEIKKKAELNLDDLDDRGFDFDEWSITDAYINGAIFGAEIVTKELEKENEQLRNNGFTISAMTEQQLKVAMEKGEQLEIENNRLTDTVVDLKCKVSEANSNAVIWTEELVAENKYLTKQLTKAKEIIKGLLLCCRNYPQENAEKIEQAEQFLKEDGK